MKSLVVRTTALLGALAALAPSVLAEPLFAQEKQLTDANWFSNVKPDRDSIWVVTFYAPWDPNAKAFAPEMDAATTELKAKGLAINFGATDVTVNKRVGWKYQIQESPTIKIFTNVDGEEVVEEYSGERTKEGIVDFMTDFFKATNILHSNMPADFTDGEIVTLDEDNFDQIVMESNEIWELMFAAPWCYHCNLMRPAWTEAAQVLGKKVRFGIVDADANRSLARRFKVQKLPWLRYYEAGYGKTDDSVKVYEGGRTLPEIVEHANELRAAYDADPEKFGYSEYGAGGHGAMGEDGEECDADYLMSDEPAPAPGEDEDCDDPTLHQGGVPGEVEALCTDGCLCVVAFLRDGSYRASQVTEL